MNAKKKIICFIPARKGSSRVVNKNLKQINGKTLVEITILQALKSKIFKEIILSSDSNKILQIGKKLNIKSIKRSKKNSTNKSTTDEALFETLSNHKNDYDFIVILQVTSPLRKISTIKSFINHCLKNKLQCCLSVTEISENISFPSNYLFLPLSKNRVRSQDKKPFLLENGLIYFISKKFFMKNKKIFINNKCNIFITEKYESIDINNKKDYIIAKKLYK
jgi:CMP-N-acetylneuraminic acid synthetase